MQLDGVSVTKLEDDTSNPLPKDPINTPVIFSTCQPSLWSVTGIDRFTAGNLLDARRIGFRLSPYMEQAVSN